MKQIYIYWNLNIRTKPFEIRTLSISGPYFLRSLCWISKLQLMLNSMQFNGINDSTFSDANSIWHIFRPIYWYLKLFGHWLSEYQVYHSCWYLSIVVLFCYILNKSKQKTKKTKYRIGIYCSCFFHFISIYLAKHSAVFRVRCRSVGMQHLHVSFFILSNLWPGTVCKGHSSSILKLLCLRNYVDFLAVL